MTALERLGRLRRKRDAKALWSLPDRPLDRPLEQPVAGPRRDAAGELLPGVLPDFVIIGGMKCGTTSLYRWLCEHPMVAAVAPKEIHYFDFERNYEFGERWYRAHFPPGDDGPMSGRPWVTGEATPSYLFIPSVPGRMTDLMPHTKLIVLLRDPVERARSHWSHQRSRGREPDTLHLAMLRAMATDKRTESGHIGVDIRADSYLRRGRYAEQLERWWTYFSREQTLVLRSDELYHDPMAALKRTTSFLGLAPYEQPPAFEAYNVSEHREPMPPDTRAMLQAYFAPHNERLYRLLGEDLGWG